jgi:tetratricopeptide (TPR) repeat protein
MVVMKMRLNIEIVEVKTNKMMWRESMEIDFNSSFELLDIVAQKAVEGLNIQFSQEDLTRIEKDIPNDPLAYEYYLKSISLPLTNEGNRLAIEMLNQSIELDSGYAPAYAQLGTRIYILTMFGLRDQEDTRKAEYLFLKSFSLNSEYIYVLSRLAWLYTERGNIEEAIQEMETAVAIDPSNQEFRSIGLTYMYIGDYEKSYEIVQKFEQTSYVLNLQGILFLRMGLRDQAVGFLNQAIDLDPDGLIGLKATSMKAYIEGDFKTGLEANYRIEKVNIIDGELWYHIAVDYALLGEKEGCIRALRRAIDGGFFNYPLMLSDPFLDSMRDNTEFKELLQQANGMHLSFIRKYF